MNLAAVRAIATLGKKYFEDSNNDNNVTFGPKYIIPKSSNQRLLKEVVSTVTLAAVQSCTAQLVVKNRIDCTNQLVNCITN